MKEIKFVKSDTLYLPYVIASNDCTGFILNFLVLFLFALVQCC